MHDRRLQGLILQLWVLALLSVVLAAVTIVGFWWHIGLTRMHIIGAYSDLDSRGVVDHDALRQHFGARFADDWFLVATELLTGDLLTKTTRLANLIGVSFLVNSVCCAFVAIRLSRFIKPVNGVGSAK